MAKFTYIGDSEVCEVFGLTFPKGEAVEVADERAAAKLSANPTFEAAKRGHKASAE